MNNSNYDYSHRIFRQATSKCSDQTAGMSRPVSAFAGRTYHIVGKLNLRLNYLIEEIKSTN